METVPVCPVCYDDMACYYPFWVDGLQCVKCHRCSWIGEVNERAFRITAEQKAAVEAVLTTAAQLWNEERDELPGDLRTALDRLCAEMGE